MRTPRRLRGTNERMMKCAFVGVSWRSLALVLEIEVVAIRGLAASLEAGMHAKHISIDDDVAVVGSSNMDIRSFQLDLEVMMLVSGRSFTDELKAVEDEYRANSTEMTLETWERRGTIHRFVDNVAKLTSAVQ